MTDSGRRKGVEGRDCGKIGDAVGENVAAEMAQPVADDEIGDLHGAVVSADLVEGVLADGNLWRFELHDDERRAFGIVKHGIAASCHTVNPKAYFVSQTSLRIAQAVCHPV